MSSKALLTIKVNVRCASKHDARQVQERISNAIESGLWTCAERGIKVDTYNVEAELEPL